MFIDSWEAPVSKSAFSKFIPSASHLDTHIYVINNPLADWLFSGAGYHVV